MRRRSSSPWALAAGERASLTSSLLDLTTAKKGSLVLLSGWSR